MRKISPLRSGMENSSCVSCYENLIPALETHPCNYWLGSAPINIPMHIVLALHVLIWPWHLHLIWPWSLHWYGPYDYGDGLCVLYDPFASWNWKGSSVLMEYWAKRVLLLLLLLSLWSKIVIIYLPAPLTDRVGSILLSYPGSVISQLGGGLQTGWV